MCLSSCLQIFPGTSTCRVGLLILDSTLFMPELENRQIEDRLLPVRVYTSESF